MCNLRIQGASLFRNALSGLFAGLLSFSAHSAAVNSCDVNAWKITGAVRSSLYPSIGMQPVIPAISATSCAGVFPGNDAGGGTLEPSPNLGYLKDGLLNGQDGLLSPTQFISPSQLMDLRTPGVVEDPGWIMLGELGGNEGELKYAAVDEFNLNNVIKYTQLRTSDVGGTWLLEVNRDIITILAANGLLDRSFFDHLAFSVKAGEGWAVYDFDFNLINAANSNAFDLTIPYSLSGTWNMNTDFYNQNGKGQDISHVSVWARDPLSTNQVPLPGTVFLLGLALVLIGVTRRSAVRA